MGGILAGALEAARVGTLWLQSDVIHEAWIGQDALGAPKGYASPVLRQCFVQLGAFQVKRADGQVITTKAKLGFVGPVEPIGAGQRQEPIDPRDVFTLPGGLKAKPVEVPGGILNPETGQRFQSSVWLA